MKKWKVGLGLLAGLVLGLFPLASAMAGNVDIENRTSEVVSVNTRTATDHHETVVKAGETGREIQFSLNAITSIQTACWAKTGLFTYLKALTVAQPSVMKDYKVVISGGQNGIYDVTFTEICKYPVCP
ncbi:MAG: hypothetical protein LLG93_00055 [Deltaproteobacteria bacterium]|nr:hypothetical protein [Deltaproteobacteria bacterium]